MNKIRRTSGLVLALSYGLILILSCGGDETNGPAGPATVSGTLTLPAQAIGSTYYVLIDQDYNGDNGYIKATSGVCGSGTTINCSLGEVAAGTYYLYAVVFIVGNPESDPVAGDFVGFYGTGTMPPGQPNFVVPATGSASFNITLQVLSVSVQPGAWSATADFGGFDFTVNPEATAITSITYNFSDWFCGGVTRNGSMTVSSSTGWSIDDGQFTIQNSLGFSGTDAITITGSFAIAGDEASGTWQASVNNTTCTGTWDAASVE